MDIEEVIPGMKAKVLDLEEAERFESLRYWKIAVSHIDAEGKEAGQMVLVSDELMALASVGPEALVGAGAVSAYRQVVERAP